MILLGAHHDPDVCLLIPTISVGQARHEDDGELAAVWHVTLCFLFWGISITFGSELSHGDDDPDKGG
jgi:hypothetical protein